MEEYCGDNCSNKVVSGQNGIVTANNPALRDISAQCLAEFVKWSRKQSRGKDSASLNIKSILKRIFSLCKHPSAFKRLGEGNAVLQVVSVM